jgi:hypothetical protein
MLRIRIRFYRHRSRLDFHKNIVEPENLFTKARYRYLIKFRPERISAFKGGGGEFSGPDYIP